MDPSISAQSMSHTPKICTITTIETGSFLKMKKKSKCTKTPNRSWEIRQLQDSVIESRIRTLQTPKQWITSNPCNWKMRKKVWQSQRKAIEVIIMAVAQHIAQTCRLHLIRAPIRTCSATTIKMDHKVIDPLLKVVWCCKINQSLEHRLRRARKMK